VIFVFFSLKTTIFFFFENVSFQGGKDHSRAYYLYVELNDITKFIFRDDDKDLLEHWKKMES
jgi:hypothetical protein